MAYIQVAVGLVVFLVGFWKTFTGEDCTCCTTGDVETVVLAGTAAPPVVDGAGGCTVDGAGGWTVDGAGGWTVAGSTFCCPCPILPHPAPSCPILPVSGRKEPLNGWRPIWWLKLKGKPLCGGW